MTTVRISDIVIGERRREDYGDIDGLARSIQNHGLFHPLIIDQDNNLVAGGRRIRAYEKLGREDIEVRQLLDLSEEERLQIEEDENVQRKDLTPYELSKNMVRHAVAAAVDLKKAGVGDLSPTLGDKSKKGAPTTYGVPQIEITEALGVGKNALWRSEQFVEVVERYLPISGPSLNQNLAIKANRALSAIPEDERLVLARVVDESSLPSSDLVKLIERVVGKAPAQRSDMIAAAALPGVGWEPLYKELFPNTKEGKHEQQVGPEQHEVAPRRKRGDDPICRRCKRPCQWCEAGIGVERGA